MRKGYLSILADFRVLLAIGLIILMALVAAFIDQPLSAFLSAVAG